MGINDSNLCSKYLVRSESLFRNHTVGVAGYGIRQLFISFMKEITMPETRRRSERIREYQRKPHENSTPEEFPNRVRANACPQEDICNFDFISKIGLGVYVTKNGGEVYAVKRRSKLEGRRPIYSTSTSSEVDRQLLKKILREKKILYAMFPRLVDPLRSKKCEKKVLSPHFPVLTPCASSAPALPNTILT